MQRIETTGNGFNHDIVPVAAQDLQKILKAAVNIGKPERPTLFIAVDLKTGIVDFCCLAKLEQE